MLGRPCEQCSPAGHHDIMNGNPGAESPYSSRCRHCLVIQHDCTRLAVQQRPQGPCNCQLVCVLRHAGQFQRRLVSDSHHACKQTNRQTIRPQKLSQCLVWPWQRFVVCVSYGAMRCAVATAPIGAGHTWGLLLVRTSAYILKQSLLATAAVSRLDHSVYGQHHPVHHRCITLLTLPSTCRLRLDGEGGFAWEGSEDVSQHYVSRKVIWGPGNVCDLQETQTQHRPWLQQGKTKQNLCCKPQLRHVTATCADQEALQREQ